MKYLLLIYASEEEWAARPHDEQHAIYEEYEKVAREFEERGVMRGGDQLADTPAATTVRIREGQQLVTDGPFAETKVRVHQSSRRRSAGRDEGYLLLGSGLRSKL
jgi:hypothetical protein